MIQWMNTSASVRALTEKPLNLWQMRANINPHCWPLQFDIFPSPLWNSPYQPLWELKILSSASLSMLLNRIADEGGVDNCIMFFFTRDVGLQYHRHLIHNISACQCFLDFAASSKHPTTTLKTSMVKWWPEVRYIQWMSNMSPSSTL
jgi:hypothetical protein